MYQCIGLNDERDGGCGEDWWHPECLLGLPRDWYLSAPPPEPENAKEDATIVTGADKEEEEEEKEHPVPHGFPDEDQIDALICYKCVNSSPWIKEYAGSSGFIPLFRSEPEKQTELPIKPGTNCIEPSQSFDTADGQEAVEPVNGSKKRKVDDDLCETESSSSKRPKVEIQNGVSQGPPDQTSCRRRALPPAPVGTVSLIARNGDFRTHFCRCPDCFPHLSRARQLLEEEEVYEPPVSEDGSNAEGVASVETGSLLERGEAALSNVDRIRAIGISSFIALSHSLHHHFLTQLIRQRVSWCTTI